VPICKFAGGFAPNHTDLKAGITVAGLALSIKITDSPGAMLVMPFKATAEPKEFELSSIFQPLMFAAAVPVLVTSNQSAASAAGLLPLDHGATSEMMSVGVPPVDAVTAKV